MHRLAKLHQFRVFLADRLLDEECLHIRGWLICCAPEKNKHNIFTNKIFFLTTNLLENTTANHSTNLDRNDEAENQTMQRVARQR